MMRKFLALAMISFFLIGVKGVHPSDQEVLPGGGKKFTLEMSIDAALKNSTFIKRAREQLNAAGEDLKKSVTDFLPEFSAGYGYTRLHDEPVARFGGMEFFMGKRDNYQLNFRLSQPIFTIEAMMRIFLAVTRGMKHMQDTVYVEKLLVTGFRLACFVMFIPFMHMGLHGAALGYTFSVVAGAGAAFLFCTRRVPLWKKGVPPAYQSKQLILFSLPMIPSSFARDISKEIDVLILGWFASPSAVGIYAVALRVLAFSKIFFRALEEIFNPFIADLYNKKEMESLSGMYQLITRWSLMLIFPVFLIITLYPSFFMNVFDKDLVSGAPCLAILMLSLLFSAFSSPAGSIIVMSGHSALSLKNNLFYFILKISLNFILVPPLQLIGAAIAHGTALFVLAALRVIEVYKIIHIQPFLWPLLKPLIAAPLALTPMLLYTGMDNIRAIPEMALWTAISLFLYGLLTIALKLDGNDRHLMRVIKKKVSALYA